MIETVPNYEDHCWQVVATKAGFHWIPWWDEVYMFGCLGNSCSKTNANKYCERPYLPDQFLMQITQWVHSKNVFIFWHTFCVCGKTVFSMAFENFLTSLVFITSKFLVNFTNKKKLAKFTFYDKILLLVLKRPLKICSLRCI